MAVDKSPTILMQHESGRQIRVYAADRAVYENKGYTNAGHGERGDRVTVREPVAETPEPETETDRYSSLRKTELRQLLEERGLDSDGTKDEMVARLEE